MALNTTEEGIITLYTITLQVLSSTGGLVNSERPCDVIYRSKDAPKLRWVLFNCCKLKNALGKSSVIASLQIIAHILCFSENLLI